MTHDEAEGGFATSKLGKLLVGIPVLGTLLGKGKYVLAVGKLLKAKSLLGKPLVYAYILSQSFSIILLCLQEKHQLYLYVEMDFFRFGLTN